jgi:hypothetical protein
VIEPSLAHDIMLCAYPHDIRSDIFFAFEAGSTETALGRAREGIDVLEREVPGLGRTAVRKRLSSELAWIHNAYGFMLCSEGRPVDAAEHFTKAIILADEEGFERTDQWLFWYNLAQSLVTQGRFAEASREMATAIERMEAESDEDLSSRTWLLAHFPKSPAAPLSELRVVFINDNPVELRLFVQLQGALITSTRDGRPAVVLDDVPEEVVKESAALTRLIGWLELVLNENAEEAVRRLESALELGAPTSQVLAVREELQAAVRQRSAHEGG